MSRLLLALDTATERTAVGLAHLTDDVLEVLGGAVVDAPRAAMSRLLPMTESLLASHQVTLPEIDGVIVGRGPGSFTGVRIGVATAKGISHGLACPLWGVGTLDAIGWRFAETDALVAVAGDAMRGEVYPALFRCGDGVATRLAPDTVARPEDVARAWAELDEPLLLAGNGLRKYESIFTEALGSSATIADEDLWAPNAAGLFDAWLYLLESGGTDSGDPGALLPVYTRLSDAEENERIRAGLSPRPAPDSGVAGGERS